MTTKLIFSPQLAQYLLHQNFQIVDLKPKRDYPNETVFVFKVDSDFNLAITNWLAAKDEEGY